MIHSTLLQVVGNTPLVKIDLDVPARVYAKLEYLNPSGSVKDRSALYLIEEAERTGTLRAGGTIIEASSGNQGIAAAMIGAVKGYRVIITVSEKSSTEKVQAIRAYGAQVIVCPAVSFITDHHSYQSTAWRIHKQTPNSIMLNQYFNVSNRDAYYYTLGPELWKQTNGSITHFFAAAGSGGTITGVGRYLKEQNPTIKICGIDCATSYRSTQGNPQPYKLEGIGVDFDSPVIDYQYIDKMVTVTDNDALIVLKKLARQGFLLGPASGAAAWGVLSHADQLSDTDVVVVIFTDSGRAYLTKQFYDVKHSEELNVQPMQSPEEKGIQKI